MFRVMLVEDDRIFREVLKQELSQWFPSVMVDVASDGKEAMEKMDSDCPELIFMDIRLPGESGLQLTRKIKSKFPHALVAVLTSYDLPEYRQAAEESGASQFFIKGMTNGSEIKWFVESVLGKNECRGPEPILPGA